MKETEITTKDQVEIVNKKEVEKKKTKRWISIR